MGETRDQKHPNIVWIFLDQCRADVLSCYGHPFIRTPNLDRLAAEGVLFTNAFCQNSVCVPSRASILSGRYSSQTGVYDNSGQMRAEDSHLLRAFLQAGYHTANVGKIHTGLSAEAMGFQEHREIEHDGIPHYHLPADYPAEWPWKTFASPNYPQPVLYATDLCPPERTYCGVGVSAAIDIWTRHNYQASPLFLRLSLDRPHTPVSSPKPYDTLYAGQTALPEYTAEEQNGQLPLLQEYIRDRLWDRFTPDEIRHIRSYYYGLMTHLDTEVGRLLDAIRRSPQAANTLVVLAADHGCMLGEHGLYVKSMHYHTETARVPLILSWPGQLPQDRRMDNLVEMVDFLPTLCELARLPIPAPAMGRSLLPLIDGRQSGREEILAEQFSPDSPHRWLAVRTRQALYTRYANSGEESLYDLTSDPDERVNLADSRGAASLLREMQNRLQKRLDQLSSHT
jgi:choline-sulfatase